MPVSQAARESLLQHVTLFRGDATNITDTEGLALLPAFKVLADCTLKRLSLDCATLTAASQFTISIKKNGVALTSISTATPGVPGTPTTVDVDLDLDKDDVLSFTASGADADGDDATGVTVGALIQQLRDQSDA
jgi:hypothetical protein